MLFFLIALVATIVVLDIVHFILAIKSGDLSRPASLEAIACMGIVWIFYTVGKDIFKDIISPATYSILNTLSKITPATFISYAVVILATHLLLGWIAYKITDNGGEKKLVISWGIISLIKVIGMWLLMIMMLLSPEED